MEINAAWVALVNTNNDISNAGRVTSLAKLLKSELQPGYHLDMWLYAMSGAGERLHEHGAVIMDPHLADRILKILPDE